MATILIVDDNSALRESLAETVAGLGHRPLSAASGQEALARLECEAVDAVLLDLRMPDMDGIEVLRRLRDNPKRPPVVILTAFASARRSRLRFPGPRCACSFRRCKSAITPLKSCSTK